MIFSFYPIFFEYFRRLCLLIGEGIIELRENNILFIWTPLWIRIFEFYGIIYIAIFIFFASFVICIAPSSGESHLQIFSCHIRTDEIILREVSFEQLPYFFCGFLSYIYGSKSPYWQYLRLVWLNQQYTLFPNSYSIKFWFFSEIYLCKI